MIMDITNNRTRAEELIEQNRQKQSKSEEYWRKKGVLSEVPEITNRMARSVSNERREIMELQMQAGEYREQGSSSGFYSSQDRDPSKIRMVQTQAGVVSSSASLFKTGTASGNVTSSTSSGWRGSNDTGRQIPEVYSPLWLNSNLNLPRDRPTINAWSRSFFALNPFVHNAITLHSTYPIAKLNIKCKNPKIEKFFGEMIDEIDLMNIAVMAAQEYWVLGEAFIYGDLDESAGKWSRLMILNPDYVNVQRNVIAAEPIISLRPDENLRRVVNGNQQSDIIQRKQLDPSIVEHVRRNENIPLNNFYVHHMARRISPYEIRGTGLVVSVFRALMLFDKLRECYSSDTEVLTKDGWHTIDELLEITTENKPSDSKFTKGLVLDGEGSPAGILKLKDIEVACFDPETEAIAYHRPLDFHLSEYKGKLLHFTGENVDIKVTPNHKMWVGKDEKYEKIQARNLLEQEGWKFRAISDTCTETLVELQDKKGYTSEVKEEDYSGLVWCFEVTTGLFITRRNGKVTIQGNSKYAQADNLINPLTLVKIGNNDFRPTPVDLEHWRNVFESAQYDKNFKIFTHDAVTVEPIGFGSGIYDTSNDIQQLIKEIYVGLMVPSVIMDGSDTTYATGSVALDVLRQRYMQFRQMMTTWLKRKIFAPISQIQDFYEYEDGEKTLVVPDVDWNQMSLFDADSYINNMINLSQPGEQKRVSLQTLYRSLGLEYEEEQRKIRYENIQDAIQAREKLAMSRLPLHELKSLGPLDEIEETTDEPVPGQSPYVSPEAAQQMPGAAPPMGGLPPAPSLFSAGPKPGGAPPPAPIGGGGPKPPSAPPTPAP